MLTSSKYIFSSLKRILKTKATNKSSMTLTEIKQCIQQDVEKSTPKYTQYFPIIRMFSDYCKNLQYQTIKTEQYTNNILTLIQASNKYPSYKIPHNILVLLSQTIFRNLQLRSQEQMETLLQYVLSVDEKASENAVFLEYLKFYVRNQFEVIKAQYKVSYKNETIGSYLKNLATAMIQKSFLPRTPLYNRTLAIINHSLILNLLICNNSTSNSLMIRKVYYEYFMHIKNFYENNMKQNLYHHKNFQLWQKLNQTVTATFNTIQLIEDQAQYLRELYVTLFLVLQQKCQLQILFKNIDKTIYAYKYIKQQHNQNSKKSKKFIEKYKLVINTYFQQYYPKNPYNLSLDNNLFILWQQFPEYKQTYHAILTKQIVPLTFKIYISEITQHFSQLSPELINKINCEYLQNLNFKEYVNILHQINHRKDLKQLYQFYNDIIQCLLNKQDTQISNTDIVNILTIYIYHQIFQLYKSQSLTTLRIFLFRYISDHCQHIKKQELEEIVHKVIKLNDTNLFNDEDNNYPYNIYEEIYMQLTKQSKFINLNNDLVELLDPYISQEYKVK